MKRISFAFAAAVALLVNACEKHPAAETESALHKPHAEGSHGGDHAAAPGADVHANPAPLSPTGVVPTNPGGSGPADTQDPALNKGGGNKEPGAVKYFPKDEKK
jgi:hypothetical protein